jgi:hypothetical protein
VTSPQDLFLPSWSKLLTAFLNVNKEMRTIRKSAEITVHSVGLLFRISTPKKEHQLIGAKLKQKVSSKLF